MRSKIGRLLAVETVMGRQRFVAHRRPVTDLLFGCHRRVPLRRGSFVNDAAHEVDLGAELRKHRRGKNLLLREPESLSRLQHDEEMTRRFGMNKFIGNFFADRPHQIPIDFKKSDIAMISACRQRIDFDRISAEVSEKCLQHVKRQLAGHQLLHEGFLIDFGFPALADHRIELIDDRFRLTSRVFFSQCNFHCHMAPLLERLLNARRHLFGRESLQTRAAGRARETIIFNYIANRCGENAAESVSVPPRRISAASAPTDALVVMPCPPSPATQKKFESSPSQPMTNLPSGVKVRKPAQPLLILTPARPGMKRSIFSANNSLTLSSTGGSPGVNSC